MTSTLLCLAGVIVGAVTFWLATRNRVPWATVDRIEEAHALTHDTLMAANSQTARILGDMLDPPVTPAADPAPATVDDPTDQFVPFDLWGDVEPRIPGDDPDPTDLSLPGDRQDAILTAADNHNPFGIPGLNFDPSQGGR